MSKQPYAPAGAKTLDQVTIEKFEQYINEIFPRGYIVIHGQPKAKTTIFLAAFSQYLEACTRQNVQPNLPGISGLHVKKKTRGESENTKARNAIIRRHRDVLKLKPRDGYIRLCQEHPYLVFADPRTKRQVKYTLQAYRRDHTRL